MTTKDALTLLNSEPLYLLVEKIKHDVNGNGRLLVSPIGKKDGWRPMAERFKGLIDCGRVTKDGIVIQTSRGIENDINDLLDELRKAGVKSEISWFTR